MQIYLGNIIRLLKQTEYLITLRLMKGERVQTKRAFLF